MGISTQRLTHYPQGLAFSEYLKDNLSTTRFPKSEVFGLENHLEGGFHQESKLAVATGSTFVVPCEQEMK